MFNKWENKKPVSDNLISAMRRCRVVKSATPSHFIGNADGNGGSRRLLAYVFISAKRGPERKEPIAVVYPRDAADHAPLLSL
jgi:hypothetical protein